MEVANEPRGFVDEWANEPIYATPDGINYRPMGGDRANVSKERSNHVANSGPNGVVPVGRAAYRRLLAEPQGGGQGALERGGQ